MRENCMVIPWQYPRRDLFRIYAFVKEHTDRDKKALWFQADFGYINHADFMCKIKLEAYFTGV